MKKKLLSVAFIVLFLMLFFLLGNNRNSGKGISLSGNSFIEGIKIIHKKDGNNIWTLSAKKADISSNEDRAVLNDIAMTIEDKGLTIHAADGIYDFLSRNLTLNGSITAIAKDYTITADSAEWDQSKNEIRTKGNVKMESKKFSVEGEGIEADSQQKVRILKNVKATFYR
jgi:LPS export ABC transporter protein LptC